MANSSSTGTRLKESGTSPNKTIFVKKSVARWAERSPGKRGLVRRIGDEEIASGRFDSEAENKKAFLNFFVTFFFQEKKVLIKISTFAKANKS